MVIATGGSGVQDVVALAIVAAAVCWLGRHVVRRLVAPPCRPPEGGGFVPLDVLTGPQAASRAAQPRH